MKERTRLDHEVRLEQAVRYIEEHLDEPIDLRELADHVCLSRFHFHRLFRALLGETVGEMVRRLRLERAANRLRTTDTPILDLALEAGYATHEAFIRAFRAAFGYTPSDLRRRLRYEGQLPTPNGVHFGEGSQVRFLTPQGDITVDVQIREIGPRKAVCITHEGPYFMIGQTFSQVWKWFQETGTPLNAAVALYYDDPESTPPAELKSDAGMIVPDDFTTSDPRVHIVDIASGTYAVGTHCGPYDGISKSWGEMMGQWLPSSGYSMDCQAPLEVYLNDIADTPPADLRTELQIPIKRPQA